MKPTLISFGKILILIRFAFGAKTLESYNVDTSSITISGISSGGAMAMQFHVAFSSEIQGAAIYAGVPYACGIAGLDGALDCIANPGMINVSDLVTQINSQATSGKIDCPTNLSDSKVFVFHGLLDVRVDPIAGHKLQELYEHFGALTETEYNLEAAHGYPTNFYGGPCDTYSPDTDFINHCDYHAAHIGLNYLLGGSLNPPASTVSGNLIEFDQTEFGAGTNTSMDSVGYLYVPSACEDKSKQCKLHIAFHGCQQSRSHCNDTFPTKTGYLEVAEANDIIILFPQTAPNEDVGNPLACWDWWAYLGGDFVNQDGAQMKAVHNMMTRVSTCESSTGCNPEVRESPVLKDTHGELVASGVRAECESGEVSFHPIPGNCQLYTMCACGASFLLECAQGLYFDPTFEKCNFMQLVPGCD